LTINLSRASRALATFATCARTLAGRCKVSRKLDATGKGGEAPSRGLGDHTPAHATDYIEGRAIEIEQDIRSMCVREREATDNSFSSFIVGRCHTK